MSHFGGVLRRLFSTGLVFCLVGSRLLRNRAFSRLNLSKQKGS